MPNLDTYKLNNKKMFVTTKYSKGQISKLYILFLIGFKNYLFTNRIIVKINDSQNEQIMK